MRATGQSSTLLVVFVAASLLLGCGVESVAPLSVPGSEDLDLRLVGIWHEPKHDEAQRNQIRVTIEGQQLVVVFLSEVGSDGEKEEVRLVGHTTRLGDGSYLNLRWPTDPTTNFSGYLLAKYRFENGALFVSGGDNGVIEQAMKEGAIRVEVYEKQVLDVTVYRISEPPERIREFVKQWDSRLFVKYDKLVRVTEPVP